MASGFRFVQPILTFDPTVIVDLLMHYTVTLIEYLAGRKVIVLVVRKTCDMSD